MKKFFKTIRGLRKQKWQKICDEMIALASVEARFESIFLNNLWRNRESISGSGSTLKFTKNLREHLPKLFEEYSINTVFDAPCGDMNWMRLVIKNTSINYVGGDIVKSLIESLKTKYENDSTKFIHINIITDILPHADLMICRDCLFHLSNNDILMVLRNFIDSGTKYLLTTTYKRGKGFVNEDIVTGSYRVIDLYKPPFNLDTRPHHKILDGKPNTKDRFMCLWSREQVDFSLREHEKTLALPKNI